MYPILETQYPVNFPAKRFTEVKRINNSKEVGGFYNDCVKRLRTAEHWNYTSLFNFAYKVTAHDDCGLAIHREIEKGDHLKVTSQTKIAGDSRFWFLVENIYTKKEHDASEESVCLTLSEIENPGLISEGLSINDLRNKCELHLRRLINTISLDIHIIDQNTIDQRNNFLNYFKWDAFAKNILLQL